MICTFTPWLMGSFNLPSHGSEPGKIHPQVVAVSRRRRVLQVFCLERYMNPFGVVWLNIRFTIHSFKSYLLFSLTFHSCFISYDCMLSLQWMILSLMKMCLEHPSISKENHSIFDSYWNSWTRLQRADFDFSCSYKKDLLWLVM